MVFSSAVFLLLFLPLFLVFYELSPKTIKNYTLLLFSLIFYAWGAPRFIFILLAFTIINYFIVKAMDKTQVGKKKKSLLTLSIVLNLALLVVFKYSNMFIHSLNDLLNALGMTAIYWREIALPIGISFFIFQSITYSVDVYRGQSQRARTYFNYLLYIISFPQLIAGPIVRYQTIAEEIDNREASYEDKIQGLYRFIIGLAKKAILANTMALQARYLFGVDGITLSNLSSLQAWVGLVAYSFQIYFDFSGYSDMAIGLGRIMGFHYPENFNMPYLSKSIGEFWRRWHMTLGDFMKNYIYIPLGGSRTKTKLRHYFNLWVVFLLCGLWHGAAWTYVLWGAYHGLFIVLEKLGLSRLTSKLGSWFQVLFTFFLVCVGRMLYVSDDISDIAIVFKTLFSFKGGNFELEPTFILMLVLSVLFAFCFEGKRTIKIKQFFYEKAQYTKREHLVLAPTMMILLIIAIAHIIATGFNPFIYFKF